MIIGRQTENDEWTNFCLLSYQTTTLNSASDCTKVPSTRMHRWARVLRKYLPLTGTAVTMVRFASPAWGAFLPQGITLLHYLLIHFFCLLTCLLSTLQSSHWCHQWHCQADQQFGTWPRASRRVLRNGGGKRQSGHGKSQHNWAAHSCAWRQW